MIETMNPATGEKLETYEEHTDDQVNEKLARAWSRWQDHWRHAALEERLEVLKAAADVLDKRREEWSEMATREMGKPISSSRSEIEKCAWLCRHYVDHARTYLQPEMVATDAYRSYVRYDPMGPIFCVMPWNFPYWQVFRLAIPNLAGGNTVLLKHSSNTTGVALNIEEIFREAGAPEGCFTTLVIGHETAADVIADKRVRGVSVTGSDFTGRSVGETAGKNLKKTVLELGGSDPVIVLEDADLEQAARIGAQSRMVNNGESCIAAKRFVVVREVYDEFLERFKSEMEAFKVGDPMEDDTEVGPMAREDLRDDLHDQVQRSLDEGAELVTGGEKLDRSGWFYAPTVLSNVSPHVTAAEEETFGPVAAVMEAEHEEAAIALANSTRFGLGASIWTNDLERGERVAKEVEAGLVFVNEMVKSDPRLPFGGVKDSGYGRELSWPGAREFMNTKTVWVSNPGTGHGTVHSAE